MERKKASWNTCCLSVDVVRKIDRVRGKGLYNWLCGHWRYSRAANWDCGRDLGDVGYATDKDTSVATRNVGVEMWTIGRVSSLRLEVLFWWSDHDGWFPVKKLVPGARR